MNDRNTFVRTLHDMGAAVWLGGSLMGAVGLNGASRNISDTDERVQVTSSGWARWAPFSAVAIGSHVVGGIGLLLANRDRVKGQSGVTANTAVKTALTLAAIATTAYSGLLGAKLAKAGRVHAEGGVVPDEDTPVDIAASQRALRNLQWVTPALTAAIVALGSQQGEQQRPAQMFGGFAAKAARIAGR